ncbi:TonB dependent receptor [compost metagenome]
MQSNLAATVQNEGLEFELNTTNIKTRSLIWKTSFNLSIPKNKLIKFPNIEQTPYNAIYIVGEPLAIRKNLYHFKGVNPQTGLNEVEDFDQSGTASIGDQLITKFIGQKFFGGIQNDFTYKGLSLGFLFQFVKQEANNYLFNTLSRPGAGLINQPLEVINRWQMPGDNVDIQKYGVASTSTTYTRVRGSDASISDASFIRLKNFYLSYEMPKGVVTNKLGLRQSRIFFQGQNLLTITQYKGLDPETLINTLPPLCTISLGIQFTL